MLILLSPTSADPAAVAEPAPAASMFLVASRDLTDPNFSRSVVLLLRYDEGGAMGIIVNRRTRAFLKDALPGADADAPARHHVYLGGPVELGTLRFLTRSAEALDEADFVLGDIQVSASRQLLEQLVIESPGDSALRVFVGYAGWAPGQLDGEIARGGWHVVPATASQVFTAEPARLWSTLVPPPVPISAMATGSGGAPTASLTAAVHR